MVKAKDKIKELFQSEAGKLVVEYLQLQRQNNLDRLAYNKNDEYSQGKLQGEISGYNEILGMEHDLSKWLVKEDKLQMKREEK
jgi:hypothetical protein